VYILHTHTTYNFTSVYFSIEIFFYRA